MQLTMTMDEIFTNIKNKNFFENDILDKENQEYIFDNTESVNVHYGEHPLSSLGILKKKV